MIKLIARFINDIRVSKANAAKYSAVVGAFVFIFVFMYQDFLGTPRKDTIIIGILTAAVLFVAFFFMCQGIARHYDKVEEKEEAKKQKEIEERRKRAQDRNDKKVNNKKKKKNK